jgi:hypothetical protein
MNTSGSFSTSVLLLISLLILPYISANAQTQMHKAGSVLHRFCDTCEDDLIITSGKTIINGKEYFIRNTYRPWISPSLSAPFYERIEDQSVYQLSGGTDTLIFRFDWMPGTVIKSDTVINYYIYEQRLDSILLETIFLPDDTIYYISNYGIDISTGDTSYSIPEVIRYSKKIGWLDYGIWSVVTGVKVDGVRYGGVAPYPEEVIFSPDSIHIENEFDTTSYFLVNTSDYPLILDSLLANNEYGYLIFVKKNGKEDFFINLFGLYPNHPADTLKYRVPPHDSVMVEIYQFDLCPICRNPEPKYFTDSLTFSIRYLGGDYMTNYRFHRFIPVTGYAVMDAGENLSLLRILCFFRTIQILLTLQQ